MNEKRRETDIGWKKYTPILPAIVLAVSIIGSWFTLQARADQTENRTVNNKELIEANRKAIQEIKEQSARIDERTKAIKENLAVQTMDIKAILRAIRPGSE